MAMRRELSLMLFWHALSVCLLCLALPACAPVSPVAKRSAADSAPSFSSSRSMHGSESRSIFVRTHFAKTDDGWSLALHRYVSATAPLHATPVVLCHGIASNAAFWDLDAAHSLARALCSRGFDVWAVDLRGVGESIKPGWVPRAQFMRSGAPAAGRFGKEDWTLDDIIHLDIPAVLRYVRAKTGRQQLSWVGHDFGASALAAYLGTRNGNSVKNFVAVGMPMTFVKPVNDLAAEFAKQQDKSRWDEFFHETRNTELSTTRALRDKAAEDIPAGVLEQWVLAIRSGEFLSSDRRTSYAKSLEKITAPVFFVAGPLDTIAAPADVQKAYEQISSPDKSLRVFQRANGYSADYGHHDLIAGKHAQNEVYAAIAQWLQDRS